jgi:hypothetical protein
MQLLKYFLKDTITVERLKESKKNIAIVDEDKIK